MAEPDASLPRGAVGLFDGRLDRGAQVVRPQVEQHEPGIELRQLEQVLRQPVEPLDLLAARLEELGARVGVRPGLALEQLVERPQGRDRGAQLVRDIGQEVAAAVAIAADDLDALLEPVGHRVELGRQLGQLDGAGAELVGRDARLEVAFGERPGRLGQTAQRGGEAPGQDRRDHDASGQREERDRREQAGDVGQRLSPEGVRVREGDLDRVRLERAVPAGAKIGPTVVRSWVCPCLRDRAERDIELAVRRPARRRAISVLGSSVPKRMRTSAWASVSARSRWASSLANSLDTAGFSCCRAPRSRSAQISFAGRAPRGAEHRLRADLEVRPLLLA